jgi:hypothetical protein
MMNHFSDRLEARYKLWKILAANAARLLAGCNANAFGRAGAAMRGAQIIQSFHRVNACMRTLHVSFIILSTQIILPIATLPERRRINRGLVVREKPLPDYVPTSPS